MKVGNLNLNVRIEGEGVPFVWGHGLTSNMKIEDTFDLFKWKEIPNTVRLVRYDARGHGQSEATYSPRDYIWSNLARDMISIADACNIDSFVAGGQSMGCATAIYAASLVPNRVKGLVLVNPPTAWESRAKQASLYRRNARLVRLLGTRVLASVIKRMPDRLMPGYIVESMADRMNVVVESIRASDRRALANVFEGAALCDFPPRDDIALIKMPTLILAWEGDKSHPVESAQALHTLIPQSELIVAKDMSDLVPWPSRIREFLQKQP